MSIYEELSEIFSNDLNQKASRDLLIQVFMYYSSYYLLY